jgi:hypothetical protein
MLYRLGVLRCILTLYECITFDYMNRIIAAEVIWLSVNIFLTLGVVFKIIFSIRKKDWDCSEE